MNCAFKNNTDYKVTQLTLKDWEHYKDFIKSLKTPAHYKYIWDEYGIETPYAYQKLAEEVQEENGVAFALWHKNKIIGQSFIFQTK